MVSSTQSRSLSDADLNNANTLGADRSLTRSATEDNSKAVPGRRRSTSEHGERAVECHDQLADSLSGDLTELERQRTGVRIRVLRPVRDLEHNWRARRAPASIASDHRSTTT